MNHQQIGDPTRLGPVLIKLSEMDEPPVRFAADSDAVGFALDKAEALRSEVERMRELSSSTDRALASASRPMRWKLFLPMSMPRVATC
jgi:hypothetical protein